MQQYRRRQAGCYAPWKRSTVSPLATPACGADSLAITAGTTSGVWCEELALLCMPLPATIFELPKGASAWAKGSEVLGCGGV